MSNANAAPHTSILEAAIPQTNAAYGAVYIVGVVPEDATVSGVSFIAGEPLIGDDTNYRTIMLINKGSAGDRLRPEGEWSDVGDYFLNDLVTHNGDSYRALAEVPEGSEPGVADSYWQVLPEDTALASMSLTSGHDALAFAQTWLTLVGTDDDRAVSGGDIVAFKTTVVNYMNFNGGICRVTLSRR